jgi:hypothetical protein
MTLCGTLGFIALVGARHTNTVAVFAIVLSVRVEQRAALRIGARRAQQHCAGDRRHAGPQGSEMAAYLCPPMQKQMTPVWPVQSFRPPS